MIVRIELRGEGRRFLGTKWGGKENEGGKRKHIGMKNQEKCDTLRRTD